MEPKQAVDLWHYGQIELREPERATRLRDAPEWPDLMAMTCHALGASLAIGATRFGFDESGRNANDLRAVLQFPVGEQLFDWFFNSRTGYRAQFRKGAAYGNDQNSLFITMMRRELEVCTLFPVAARQLSRSFDDHGPVMASAQDFLTSLDPSLSKVWFCARLIRVTGGIEHLRVFCSTPDLAFRGDCAPWCSVYADESNAWLDIKGAFVSASGLYQLKDPGLRAQGLHWRGTA
jgi:hypothetical protein